MKVLAIFLLLIVCLPVLAAPCTPYRGIITRTAHQINGLNAPVPMYSAQMEQESGCRPGITAWDGGQGIAQMMPATASDLYSLYPSLGKPEPMNPGWAIPALIRYDTWLGQHVQAVDDCNRRAAALTAYNGGLGYVQYSQARTTIHGQWFGGAETVKTRQSADNFKASRNYPRIILYHRQPHYAGWGRYTCEGMNP